MGDNTKRKAHSDYPFRAFRASQYLEKYLKKKLEIEKRKKEPGYQLSEMDERESKANNKNKNKVLNKHLFPSIANLVYFFEFINKHPELDGIFDEDVQDLFGLRGPHVKRHKVSDGKYLIFLRLLDALLSYENTLIVEEFDGKTYTERRTKKKDFDVGRNIRLQLVSGIVTAALESLQDLSAEKEGDQPTIARLKIGSLIAQDFRRTSDWRDYYCTSQIVQNTDRPHRVIGF